MVPPMSSLSLPFWIIMDDLINRHGRPVISPCCDAILPTSPLVIPLSCFSRPCRYQPYYRVSCFQAEDPGWCAVLILFLALCPLFSVPAECLAEIGQASTPKSTSEDSIFTQILHSKAVHFLAFFLLVYVGIEVTIGGESKSSCAF